MKIHSLGRRTDLFFHAYGGVIEDKGTHIVLRTPDNPTYHWGNYLLFADAPILGDEVKWPGIFREAFPEYGGRPGHYSLAWNGGPPSEEVLKRFQAEGFELQENLVLASEVLSTPAKRNTSIEIRPFASDEDWEEGIRLHVESRESFFEEKSYEVFKRAQNLTYRKMSTAGRGNRFGAFKDGELVGDLGLFHRDGLARYQNVMTHPLHRREGICGELVFWAGTMALRDWDVHRLVMEADPSGHAARIYESVGFRPVEKNYAFYRREKQRLSLVR